MSKVTRSPIQHYGFAVGTVTIALTIAQVLNSKLATPQTPFLLFFGAVLLSGFYGEIRSGLLTSILSALAIAYFILPPQNSLELATSQIGDFILFITEAIALIFLLNKNTPNPEPQEQQTPKEPLLDIIETLSLPFLTLNDRWQLTYLNPACETLLTTQPSEAIGQSIWQVFPTITESDIKQHFHTAIAEQIPVNIRYTTPDNSQQSLQIWAYPSQNNLAIYLQNTSDGPPSRAPHDRQQTETAIATINLELEQRLADLQTLLGLLPVGIAISYDSESEDLCANPCFQQLFNGAHVRLCNTDTNTDNIPCKLLQNGREIAPKDLPMQLAASQGLEVRNAEIQVVHPSGTRFDLLGTATPLFDPQGTIRGCAAAFVDISDRKRIETALYLSETRFAQLAQNIPGVIYQYRQHPDGRSDFPYLSSGCIDLYEIDSTEIQQHPHLAWKVIHPDDSEAFRHSLKPQAMTGQQWRHEWRIVTPSGKVKWLQGIARSERQADGFILWDGLLLDITERKQAEYQRESLLACEQAAREAAEAANRAKDQFLAVLSHELRTPLNPILGWAQMLRSRKLNQEATARALEIIERNARLQTQLIDDLLDVSRILRGKLSLNISPVSLHAMIQAALETVSLAAKAKSIEVQTLLDADVGMVLGDAGRLQQVVWNLLSNAVKFTPKGGRVEVRLERLVDTAQIRVSDTGIGIDPEFVPYVFDYFRQADSTTTRQFGGLGLGLAIARHIVELHGGMVAAASAGEEKGSTFIIRLPLLKVEQNSTTLTKEPSESKLPSANYFALAGLRVLVVDDELDTRELITFILEESGAKVMTTASAQQALETLTRFQPDLLISDIGMPDTDGYALVNQVKVWATQQGREILAIALTAYAKDDDRRQALAAGFQLHLPKPIEPADLVAAVASLAKLQRC